MTSGTMPRLVIAAPHSHAGKTTITLALLAAFLAVLGVVFVLGPPDLLAAP